MLLAPFALVLSLLAIPIILMYVLKLRRQEHLVPSTFLWQQALEDLQADAPWQRLRFNILLLLQLCALAAIVLSLALPAYSRSHVIAGDLVVIVDESYGMQAHDVQPSRFTAALARVRTLASEMGSTNVMSVIGMSAHPHLAIAESSDGGAISHAIDSLRVGIAPPNFLEALSLATSLARAGQNTRAVVLTSRDSGISTLPLHVSFPVDIVRMGAGLRDLGVTAFSAAKHTDAVEAVARVSNFGAAQAHSDLELYVDGRLADVRTLTVRGRRVRNLFWSNLPLNAQRLQVRLTRTDDVTTDKTGWAAVPAELTRRVLLVSRGDFFLQSALLSDPSVRLTTTSPLSYVPGIERSYDVTVFDGILPPNFPAGSTLLVAPPNGRTGSLRFGKNLPAGAVTPASTGSIGSLIPLLQYVDLSDVHVAQARSAVLPAWLQPLVVSGGRTVVAAGQRGAARGAIISFDLQHSDWPLRISFPIMVQNLDRYLAPGLTLGASSIKSSTAVTVFPPPGVRSLEVTRPDGGTTVVKAPFPPFADTSRPGLYTVKAIGGTGATAAVTQSFAVNFFPARPAPAGGPTTLHLGQVQAGKTLTSSAPVSVAWIFVVLALGTLGAEWWVAFRGSRAT